MAATPDRFDPIFRDRDACAAVIDRRPDLLALVKAANDTKQYSDIESYPAILAGNNTQRLRSYVEKYRRSLEAFIENRGSPYAAWAPASDVECTPDFFEHIRSLNIPSVSPDHPGILIDRLGRFSDDAKLKSRVDGIFKKTAQTFLVNTSGSGKTRLSFEGLCQHWGFYFALAQDTNRLGSRDSADAVRRGDLELEWTPPPFESPSFWPALKKNIDILDKRLSRVVLGRLLIFHLYSEIIGTQEITEEHKRKWLLLQLRPRLEGHAESDIFHVLQISIDKLANAEVEDLIAVMLSKLRKIYGPEFHLFYVIDEAQVSSHADTWAFQRDGERYPLLQEIIRALGARSRAHEVSFVIAGTDIPRSGFKNAPFARSIRWSSDTGGFDDEGEHRRYVSRFLTPTYVASPAGQMFLDRMWTWARGRHRTTDAILKALLRDGFHTPHRLLTDYVRTTTGYRPTDYEDENEPFRNPIYVWVGELPDLTSVQCEYLSLAVAIASDCCPARLCRTQAQQIIFHYLVTSRKIRNLSGTSTDLVSKGIGRFVDKDLDQVVMDEPLFIIKSAQSVCHHVVDEDSSVLTTPWLDSSFEVLREICSDLNPKSLATFIAFYLVRAFDSGSKISDVFSIHKDHKEVCKWADKKATLVQFSEANRSLTPFHESIAIMDTAYTLSDVESWLNRWETLQAPFCLTHTATPNLLFTLQLEDGEFIRVILRSVLSDEVLKDATLQEVVRRLDREHLLRDDGEDSAHHAAVVKTVFEGTRETERPFCVLRAVASFPALADINNISLPSKDAPIANLNTSSFKRFTSGIPASVLVEQIVKNVTAPTSGKRKRSAESPVSEPPPKSPKSPRIGPEASKSPIPRLTSKRGKRRAD
ncbi:hypothetical protein R3P38DRAFT_1300252 [Favolaschia claudopus]|uniref:Uncharacterized protein n=1 Tax=Favolaschia claudopus TaxID=2862362 RepID=A0AAW0B0L3_9AGAR